MVTRAIECYESSASWEQLLHCLNRNKDFFKQEERQALVNKYVPVALNSLYKLYTTAAEGQDDDEVGGEENRGKMQEMKIRMKYQKKAAVDGVIAEEDEVSSAEEEE